MKSWKQAVAYQFRGLRDRRSNGGRARGEQKLLFIRHPLVGRNYYGGFLGWLEAEYPEIHAACEVRSLPFNLRELSQYRVAMSWVGDSHLGPGRWELGAMQQLAEALQAQGVPLVNSLASTLNSAKHAGGLIMSEAGLRTPRSVILHDRQAFQDDPGELQFPLLIRENYGHAGAHAMLKVDTPAELRRADLSHFSNPIAVEFVDVREPSGKCRRYRFIAVGEVGIAYNVHLSSSWEVRAKSRITNPHTVRLEQEFIARSNPHAAVFWRGQQALELDLIGYDYSYDRQGQMVVWEANSLPEIRYWREPGREVLHYHTENVFAALLRMLLQRAQLPIPDSIDQRLKACPSVNMPAELNRVEATKQRVA